MLDTNRFVSDVLDCLGWPYVSPGGTGEDCSQTGIDCSGLIVRAYKLQGSTIEHGSNTIWRSRLLEKGKLQFAENLQVGMVVFKWKNDGKEPEKYRHDGLGDFHHIGVVTSIHPLIITHASSAAGRVTQSTSIKTWSHWGILKSVMPAGEPVRPEDDMDNFKVVAENGKPVRMRKAPAEGAQVICSIPCGKELPGEDLGNGWTKLMYLGTTGYMMSSFLEKTSSSMTVEERLEDHERRLRALEGGVG